MYSEILELEKSKIVKDISKIEDMVKQGHWSLLSMDLCVKLVTLESRLDYLNKTLNKLKGELNNEEDI